ncbi:unnamed protein product, partial [Prorocentrum cordatum]
MAKEMRVRLERSAVATAREGRGGPNQWTRDRTLSKRGRGARGRSGGGVKHGCTIPHGPSPCESAARAAGDEAEAESRCGSASAGRGPLPLSVRLHAAGLPPGLLRLGGLLELAQLGLQLGVERPLPLLHFLLALPGLPVHLGLRGARRPPRGPRLAGPRPA